MKLIRLLHVLFVLCLTAFGLQAQVKVTGLVSSDQGDPLIGVTVRQPGTAVGTATGVDGTYSITVPDGAELVFSYTGFGSKTVRVNGAAPINVTLSESAMLDEVVVTALGITREQKSLTYAATELGGDELNRVKDANPINALSGKVAGVQINRSASGVGGSTRVVMRGNKSTRDNQVLYVIDGVPMFNFSPAQPTDVWGQAGGSGSAGRDGGDAISNINPEDIESLTVLRGASAAALYGSQAANGVILVTTKKGKEGATKVEYNSNLTFEKAAYLPELQYGYLQSATGALDSWGAKGSSTDHVSDFFQTGSTWINSLALSGGNKLGRTYLSYANTNANGVIPTSGLKRHNVNLRQTANFLEDRLEVTAGLNYTNQTGENRASSGLYFNALTGLYFFPRGLDFKAYGEDGFEKFSQVRNTYVQNWVADQDNQQNPYWVLNRNANFDKRDRYLGTVAAKYKINNNLSIQARGNLDKTFDTYDQRSYATTQGTLSDNNGRYILSDNKGTQRYGDLILSYNRPSETFSFGFNLGGSINKTTLFSQNFDSKGAGGGDGLNFANIFSIQNIKQPAASIGQAELNQELQSAFGSVQLGYKGYLYVDITGRNDWSSTLAFTDNNSFFYPSVGVTGILSQMFKTGLDFWKVRASYAQVGNGVIAYDSRPLNQISSVNGLNINTVGPLPGTSLKPELTSSLELGTDIRFWNNRVGLDLTWYKTNTENQRLSIAAPQGSGFTQYIINAGNIENSGIEALLSIDAVQKTNFNWSTSFNFTRNVNKVIELDDRLSDGIFAITGAGVNNYAMVITEGGSFGDIQGMKFKRDAQGRILINADGKPVADEMGIVGNPNPDFMLGWNNSIGYKNFFANVLIDGRFGGEVMSITQAMIDELGVSKVTGDARDAGSYTINGANESGAAVTSIDPKTFFQAVGGRAGITEHYIYDATNIRIREVALGYNFPKSVVNNWGPVKGLRLSLVARNLGFLTKEAPFDPELSMSTGTGLQGVDVFSQPATRSIGVNLGVTF